MADKARQENIINSDIEAKWDVTETERRRVTSYQGEGDASIEVGHVVTEGTKTTTDFAGAEIHVEGGVVERRGDITWAQVCFDGKVYQGQQVDDGRSHTYFEEGHTFDGIIKIRHGDVKYKGKDASYFNYDYYSISESWYDKEDKPKDEPQNSMSSPSMGIGLRLPNGEVTKAGDKLPTLYTWAEKDDKYEHHTTFYFPLEGTYTGIVIVTPPQTAGVPIQETGYWNSAKGKRTLEWKANS